jgi:hypothetical protein
MPSKKNSMEKMKKKNILDNFNGKNYIKHLTYNSYDKKTEIKSSSNICGISTPNHKYLTSKIIYYKLHQNNNSWKTTDNSQENHNLKRNKNIVDKIKSTHVNNTLNDIYKTINRINQLNGKIKNILYNSPNNDSEKNIRQKKTLMNQKIIQLLEIILLVMHYIVKIIYI